MSNASESYQLFIDELGTASPKDHQSQFYILSGCSIPEVARPELRRVADMIKFKYWGRTDIVFHSREIGRRENDFNILSDKKIRANFFVDLEKFLMGGNFKMFYVLVDKDQARAKGWNDIKIYKETTSAILGNFLLTLLTSNAHGKIVIESASAQKDFYFHKSFGEYASQGIPILGVPYSKVQDMLTSISFVSKKNYDIEEQVADLMAYAAKCRHAKVKGKVGSYEEMMLRVFDKKVFKVPIKAKIKKMKYFKKIDPFLVLP